MGMSGLEHRNPMPQGDEIIGTGSQHPSSIAAEVEMLFEDVS